MSDTLVVCHLGHEPYRRTWDLQNQIQRSVVDAKRAGRTPEHVLLSVEHAPVYTLGKSGDENNLLVDEDWLAANGAELVRTDRGGDITFHGPGQIVLYPILDLDQLFTDLGKYLRLLEQSVIDCLLMYGITGSRVKGQTGVWLPKNKHQPERKICAMGIHCSRWVTKHGLAVNVSTDLAYFESIVPCGIADKPVTSLSRELGRTVPLDEVRERLVGHIVRQFNLTLRQLHGREARDYIDELTGETQPRSNG